MRHSHPYRGTLLPEHGPEEYQLPRKTGRQRFQDRPLQISSENRPVSVLFSEPRAQQSLPRTTVEEQPFPGPSKAGPDRTATQTVTLSVPWPTPRQGSLHGSAVLQVRRSIDLEASRLLRVPAAREQACGHPVSVGGLSFFSS